MYQISGYISITSALALTTCCAVAEQSQKSLMDHRLVPALRLCNKNLTTTTTYKQYIPFSLLYFF